MFLTQVPPFIVDVLSLSPVFVVMGVIIWYLYTQMTFYRGMYIEENKENRKKEMENMQIIDRLTNVLSNLGKEVK